MCRYFKRRYPDAFIALGGPHPTLEPEYCMRKRYVDFIDMGDGEQSQLELLEAIRTDQKLIKFSEINGLSILTRMDSINMELRGAIRKIWTCCLSSTGIRCLYPLKLTLPQFIQAAAVRADVYIVLPLPCQEESTG